MPEKRRDENDLADAVEEGLQIATEDLQNTVKSLMELVPTHDDDEAKAEERRNAETRI